MPDGILLSILTALISGGAGAGAVQWLASRKREDVALAKETAETAQVEAETAHTKAETAETYAQMARSAWRDVSDLQRRLKTHEERWKLVAPILQKCADGDSELGRRMRELRLINGAAAIDEAASERRRERDERG